MIVKLVRVMHLMLSMHVVSGNDGQREYQHYAVPHSSILLYLHSSINYAVLCCTTQQYKAQHHGIILSVRNYR